MSQEYSNTLYDRTETTLFLLMSVDGKITTGETDLLDSDRDWKRIAGVKEGLHQYYQIEQSIAANSLNTGRVMAKIGINSRANMPERCPQLTFFIIDRKPHLNENGVRFLSNWIGKLYIVTNNTKHPAFDLRSQYDNLEIVFYSNEIDLKDLLIKVKQNYGIDRLTIQTGGTMNALFVRRGLIDHVVIVVAPLFVGGVNTSTLIDGLSFRTDNELVQLKALKLMNCEKLKDSYIRLDYDVINTTRIDPIVA